MSDFEASELFNYINTKSRRDVFSDSASHASREYVSEFLDLGLLDIHFEKWF